MHSSNILGIDFGTSNSAAGFMCDGQPKLIPIEGDANTLPTSLFFDFDARQTMIGSAANTALVDGLHGRYMRALKRVLGTSLMHEKRQIMNERISFVDIIGRFIAALKHRAEAQTGQRFDHVLSGRPVHFHTADLSRDKQAEQDLIECYRRAGFDEVQFMYEPEAAAFASGDRIPGLGLIVDIGGGTSDFSLFETTTKHPQIIASHGIRTGGTDFDKSISLTHVMPLLGKDSQLRREMGDGHTAMPKAIYNDLATWEMIPFLYNGKTQRDVAQMRRLAIEPEKLKRLETVLEMELGHEMAFAVESGKIEANTAAEGLNHIVLNLIQDDLTAPITKASLDGAIRQHAADISEAAKETLHMAQCSQTDVKQIIYVGGSSLMSCVHNSMTDIFPTAEHRYSDVFTAVADGLTLATEIF
ncbi:Hsp70 family protein [Sulfitobacter sp. 1151]|uniref:Hsp70 family protein n=2 Tax=Parasulfitobacter algicola TaxID=2614809 RepID=A0ABX2IRT7_9RHOB|nr:Hsp70 family protein [Sulfitobacter algicola]